MGLFDQLWPAKMMYFLGCISAAAIWNFIAVYYQDLGFSKAQIGTLQALPPICLVIGSLLWGAISDHFQQQRKIHIFTIVSSAILMYSLRFIRSFELMCVVMFLASLQSSPGTSLLDQVVMALLDHVGGEYGKQRLYGGVGYGLGAYLTGQLITMFDINWMFTVHIVFAMISVYVLTYLPPVKVPETKSCVRDGLRQLIHKPDVSCLFVVIFLMGLMFGVISSFLTLYLYNLSQGDARIVGVSIFCETLSELPAFFYADKILHKFGTTNVLLLSIIGYVIRLSYYSIMTNPWTVLPFEFLHGITFSLSWAASTNYVYRASAPGTDGTMMGLLSAMLNGFGKGFGTVIGGWIYNYYGAVRMWQSTLIGAVLSLIALYAFEKLQNKSVGTLEEIEDEVHHVAVTGMVSPANSLANSPFFPHAEEAEASPLLKA